MPRLMSTSMGTGIAPDDFEPLISTSAVDQNPARSCWRLVKRWLALLYSSLASIEISAFSKRKIGQPAFAPSAISLNFSADMFGTLALV